MTKILFATQYGEDPERVRLVGEMAAFLLPNDLLTHEYWMVFVLLNETNTSL